MTMEKVVTLYDSLAHAEAAEANLAAAGFANADMSIVAADAMPTGAALNAPGFWNRLFGRDIQQYEAATYANAVANGGVVLTVRAEEEDVARIVGILNQHKTVNVVDRAVETKIIDKADVAAIPVAKVEVPVAPIVDKLDRDQVLRLAEEQLEVGKKLVEGGATRVRTYVVEKPVEASVTLHEEHAQVARRSIDEPAYVGDVDWGEQVIEVRDMAEVPVVGKTVKYTEEVVVGKVASDRVETVRDTVRDQEVEVEEVPAVTRVETVEKVVVDKDAL